MPVDGFVLCFGGLLRLALQASGAAGHRRRCLQNTNAGAGSALQKCFSRSVSVPRAEQQEGRKAEIFGFLSVQSKKPAGRMALCFSL